MTSNSAEQRDETAVKPQKSALIGWSTNSEKKVTFEAEDEQSSNSAWPAEGSTPLASHGPLNVGVLCYAKLSGYTHCRASQSKMKEKTASSELLCASSPRFERCQLIGCCRMVMHSRRNFTEKHKNVEKEQNKKQKNGQNKTQQQSRNLDPMTPHYAAVPPPYHLWAVSSRQVVTS